MQSFPKTLSKTLQQLSITCIWQLLVHFGGFPGGSDSEESACNVGDPGSTPGLRRSPEEENGNPLLYSCLGNLMDRGLASLSPWTPQNSNMSSSYLEREISSGFFFLRIFIHFYLYCQESALLFSGFLCLR